MTGKNGMPDDLPGMSRKLPFRVPEDYFEKLPGRIMDRLEVSKPRFLITWQRQLAYAATVAILISVGIFGIRYFSDRTNGIILTADEIMDAIEYYGYDFDDDLLVSAVIESDAVVFPETPEVDPEQIIEYLAEDYIDFSEYLVEY